MENKIEKPKKFSDAEAEAFIRYLFQPRKKTVIEIIAEELRRRQVCIEEWVKRKGLTWK